MNQAEWVWLYRNNLFWLAYSMGMFVLLYHGSQTYHSKIQILINTNQNYAE